MTSNPNPYGDSTSLFCRVEATTRTLTLAEMSVNPEPRDEFEIGQWLNDRYFLKEIIGSGGMGMVYLGHDNRLDRQVAIKVITHTDSDQAPLFERMLEREAKLGAGLNHPNIAAVLDFGFHGQRSYSVFEYVEGETLRAVLMRRKTIPIEEVVPIIEVLARALDFAHSKGIVHRDLKPENLCLTTDGDLKILDFGIAHRIYDGLSSDTYFGTPAYTSPEQWQGKSVGAASDQYALGVIVFELLTGQRVFDDTDKRNLLNRQLVEPPRKPSEINPRLSPAVDQAVLRALEKSPALRFSSCREFAAAIAAVSPLSSEPRHLLPVKPEQRLAFFISHDSENSLLARNLVAGLERSGFRSWLYERDALPDIPYLRQARVAMGRCAVVLVLVSKLSGKSQSLFDEVELAYKLGCSIVPVFVDANSGEMESLGHEWQLFFTHRLRLEWHRQHGLTPLITALTEAAASLGLSPTELVESKLSSKPRIENFVWATDANQLDIGDLKHIVFRNELVDDFLQMRNKCFLAATKGLGKTLLLTYKRQLLAEDTRGQTVTMIPEGRPFLDLMDELRQLPKNYNLPLADLNLAKRIWSAALRISAISYHRGTVDAEQAQDELVQFPATIQKWLVGGKIEPTVVFRELTSLTLGSLNRLLNDTENFLAKKMRSIHSGTFFFVDKVDQAIRSLPPEAWIYVQAGLIEAAWDLMGSNRHLRVFATIRQEAFSNYHSDIKNNLFGATTTLQYSEEELSGMLDQLANCYEGCRNFNEFVGFNVIRHPRRPSPEDCFHFVRRHSFGRPRDLVMIASEISARRATLDENRLGDLVHNISATALINNIFSEVSVLLDCLNDEQQRGHFFSLLPRNILAHAEAVKICEQFNGLEPGTIQQLGENSSGIYHPFRDLYLAGLLGVVEQDSESELMIQRFRQPHDFMSLKTIELPESTYYLLHPALNRYMTMFRPRNEYQVFQHLAVGHDLPWFNHLSMVMEAERLIHRIGSVKFRESVHRLLNHTLTTLDSSSPKLLRYEVETSSSWRGLDEFRNHAAYDGVVLAFDELMSLAIA